jgi:hypothetical protein
MMRMIIFIKIFIRMFVSFLIFIRIIWMNYSDLTMMSL